jgi:hypothetical protein
LGGSHRHARRLLDRRQRGPIEKILPDQDVIPPIQPWPSPGPRPPDVPPPTTPPRPTEGAARIGL